MNRVILMGRLTRDPELKTTQGGLSVCQFTVAVDRRFKNASGERQADFINCTAWRQTAEFICNYFSRGSKIAVVGNIQTSSWDDNDGKRQYKAEVVVEEAYFTESKASEGNQMRQDAKKPAAPSTAKYYQDEYVPSPDDVVLPFDV